MKVYSQGHTENKRQSNGVCVVLWVAPIVIMSCKFRSASPSWLPRKLCRDVPSAKRTESGVYLGAGRVRSQDARLGTLSHRFVTSCCLFLLPFVTLWSLRLQPNLMSSWSFWQYLCENVLCILCCKGHLNVLSQGNPICGLACVWIMQADWAVPKLCLKGKATQSQNTNTWRPGGRHWVETPCCSVSSLH